MKGRSETLVQDPSTYSESENVQCSDSPQRIPRNIFQTWHTKEVGPITRSCIESIKEANPEFTHYLYDDNECREFIKTHYKKRILDAYDKLVPGTYRADLWRYCVLYKYGGVYLDIKYKVVPPRAPSLCGGKILPEEAELPKVKLLGSEGAVRGIRTVGSPHSPQFINYMDKAYFCKDLPLPHLWKQGIYNAFMIAEPGNAILKKCINKTVKNIEKEFYGKSQLEITGPTMMVNFFTPEEIEDMEFKHEYINNHLCITYRGEPVLYIPSNYRKEYYDPKHQSARFEPYDKLWRRRAVYYAPPLFQER